jgi:type IV pilus assembly protein PilV
MQKQQGFSLVEVMVTMLIVSIGLLGIAGILVTSIKNNQSSYGRSQATILANDIIDRMRANRGNAEDTAKNLPYNYAMDKAPASDDDSIAAADMLAWRKELSDAMPSGKGSVNVDAATKNVTVLVQWDDSHATGDSDNGNGGVGQGKGQGSGHVRTKMGMAAQQVKIETHL